MHRLQLPVVDPCDGLEPAPGSTGAGGFCTRCRKQVHDVSAMRESQLRRLLAERAGGTVCLSYRVDERGWIDLRPEPRVRTIAVAALAMLLAACAGVGGELQVPGEMCVDASGYETACSDPAAIEMMTVPDGIAPIASGEPAPQGCPIRPTAPRNPTEPGEEVTWRGPGPVGDVPIPGHEPGAVEPQAPGVGGTDAKVRVDFTIDPDEPPMLVGVVVVPASGTIERDFVPTEQLWAEGKERRQQRRERRKRLRAQRG